MQSGQTFTSIWSADNSEIILAALLSLSIRRSEFSHSKMVLGNNHVQLTESNLTAAHIVMTKEVVHTSIVKCDARAARWQFADITTTTVIFRNNEDLFLGNHVTEHVQSKLKKCDAAGTGVDAGCEVPNAPLNT